MSEQNSTYTAPNGSALVPAIPQSIAPQDRGRLIVFSVIHGSDAEHNNSNLEHKELPIEFRRRMDLSGLANTREHNSSERVGEILQTFGDEQGRVFMCSAVDTSTQLGADTARDIHNRTLGETSISHQYIEVDMSKTPTLNGDKQRMRLYVPFEVAYTKKGARNGCKVLFSAYEKDLAHAMQSSEQQFGQMADKTKKNTLHIFPRVSSTESSQITNSCTVNMSASANNNNNNSAPAPVSAPAPANIAAPQMVGSMQIPTGAVPVAPTGAAAAAVAAPVVQNAVATPAAPVDPFAAEEAQLLAKQRELQAKRAAATQAPNLNNPADLLQLVNSYDDQTIAKDPRSAQELLRVLAKQNAEMAESQKQIYDDTRKSVERTIKKLSDASKRTGAVSDDFESMMSSFMQNRSLDDLIKSNRIFSNITTAMSAALESQQQQQQQVAQAPVANTVMYQQPQYQQAPPPSPPQQPAQQFVQPQVAYQAPPQSSMVSNKALSMKQLAQELGNQPIHARFATADNISAGPPRFSTPSFLHGNLPHASIPIATSITTAASAARDGMTVDDHAAKRQRTNGPVLSDFVSQQHLEDISRALMSPPMGTAMALNDSVVRN
jgi:hypothetical protein